jgi:hypothetical protein
LLGQHRALAHLNLSNNGIGAAGGDRLRPHSVVKPLVFFCRKHLALLAGKEICR